MKWMGLNELREAYLKFFESKGHLRHKSFPLVPQNDNSLLLINAGMAPLKPYFTGQEVPPKVRMTTCQKCIRTGDIENVGITARHGTFFEMLGNFSFGDYFKEDATAWAWEFITKVLEIPEDRLYVTVYEDDHEAAEIWEKKVGVRKDRIYYLGKEDNFWEAGIDGPCGPCSEIHFDRGEEYGCGKPTCGIGCDCDRYMEFWNLVFTQFERHEDGTYTPLKQRNIDTGMGLERIAALMQGVSSIFDVDTVKAIRDKVCEIAGVSYGEDPKKDISIRVITDHIRSVTFMASDGVLPSNEGRGYVMRRLLRRAVRHAKLLGINGLFLNELVPVVVDNSKCEYNELEEKYDYITKLLTNEEKNFNETIDRGMNLLSEYIEKMEKDGKTVLDGESCFFLSDTYGFPIDLTREILEEKGYTCDEEGFKVCMQHQKETARAARGGSKYMGADETVFHRISKEYHTEFVGYTDMECDTTLDYLTTDDDFVDEAKCGDVVYAVVPKTCFYAESGGQIGDTGMIVTKTGKAKVLDTTKAVAGKTAHKLEVVEGVVSKGQAAHLTVCKESREALMRNHSCAHLLQSALRKVLGDHVHQAGQLVTADRLRFDFSHFSAMNAQELAEVEATVNEWVLSALPIVVKEMPIAEAQKMGAMALFGEKYGEVVRVVSMGDKSVEFCGGTHVANTANIGLFKIVSEASVAAGVRRIEAVTGLGVLKLLAEANETIAQASANLKLSNSAELVARTAAVMQEIKDKNAEISHLNQCMCAGKMDALLEDIKEVKGVRYIIGALEGVKPDMMREFGDKVKAENENIVCLLSTCCDGKANLMCVASKDVLAKGIHAGKIVAKAAAVAGGKGGGRPDSAMAGVPDASKLEEALNTLPEILSEMVK